MRVLIVHHESEYYGDQLNANTFSLYGGSVGAQSRRIIDSEFSGPPAGSMRYGRW